MTRKDFLRNIVNHILAENTGKLQSSFVEDLRESIGRAEVKYKFSAIDGNIENLAEYLRSTDFDEIVLLARAHRALWIIKEILESAKREYSDIESIVSAIDYRLTHIEEGFRESRVDIESLVRLLKNSGYRIEKSNGEVIIRLQNTEVRVKAEKSVFSYEITIKGRTSDAESIVKKINTIRTL
ncbi:MAG: hypothetical protein LRS47_02660 [Desulfurococcales archaeon]|nr:hypothetical protein [Desulfurococcales archaeon]